MKTKLFAALFAASVSTASLAHADVLSFGGYTKCSEFLAHPYPQQDTIWLEGLWSGLDATDTSPAHGWIGEGLKGWDIYKMVVKECKSNGEQQVQEAAYAVWSRYQAIAIGTSS